MFSFHDRQLYIKKRSWLLANAVAAFIWSVNSISQENMQKFSRVVLNGSVHLTSYMSFLDDDIPSIENLW
jgi:hypothetical protein